MVHGRLLLIRCTVHLHQAVKTATSWQGSIWAVESRRVGKGYNEYISDGILCEVCLHLPPNEASGVLATETMHCWRLTGGMGFDWDNGSPDPDIGRFQCALDGPRRCPASGVTPSLSRLTMGCGCS